jgi:hypothetical protein
MKRTRGGNVEFIFRKDLTPRRTETEQRSRSVNEAALATGAAVARAVMAVSVGVGSKSLRIVRAFHFRKHRHKMWRDGSGVPLCEIYDFYRGAAWEFINKL